MEDVQYMMEHGTETSFLVIIDSSMRSTCSCPTPSEYYISFPQPFRNVFSVEVVDAMVPRTEYSVESVTNTLAYAPGIYNTYDEALQDGSLVTARVSPGDYNTATLITALNAAVKDTALQQGHAPLEIQPTSNPVELTNKIRLVRSEPFTLFMSQSTIRHVIGFSNPATTLGNNLNWDGTPRYTTDTNLSNDTFQSVPSALSTSNAYVGPVPIETTDYIVPLTENITQTFLSESSGLLSRIILRGRSEADETVISGVLYDDELDAVVQRFTVTTSDTSPNWTTTLAIESRILYMVSASYSNGRVTLQTSEPHGLGPQELIVITGARTLALNNQWVLLDAFDTTLVISADIPTPLVTGGRVSASKELLQHRVYRIVLEPAPGIDLYRALSFRDGAVSLTGYPQGALCADVQVSRVGYKVDAPGQCNLTGERYVVIRSPNVEQFMNRDMALAFDTMMPGLGMIKITGNAGGYREERMNFLAFEPRRFHPIGKMNGINIRLETGNGRLYNAHGIDHTLLVCIKMYGPGTTTNIPKTLYPGYEPDVRKMLIKKLEQERLSACQPYT